MFTGIITHVGKFEKREKSIFTFSAEKSFLNKLKKGTSTAINGICLTVLKKPVANSYTVEIMPETEKKTNLQYLTYGDPVNLELPATNETFLSGHIVQGHIDGVGKIISIEEADNSHLLTISVTGELSKYIVNKGSIAINGISLTIIEIHKNSFSVGILPYTWEHTMLYTLIEGDYVNIETDVLAKYVEKLIKT